MMNHWINRIFASCEQNQMTYPDFINHALYDPTYGYYMKDKKKIGRDGDFITNSSIHSVFGEHFAQLFIEWIKVEKLEPRIIELGGGTGEFAAYVLSAIQRKEPALYDVLSYQIIDISPFHRKEQKERLSHHSPFQSLESIDAIVGQQAIIFANEWLDAFPVAVVERKDDILVEIGVQKKGNQLKEVTLPTVSSDVLCNLLTYFPNVPQDFRVEVPVSMIQELKALYQKLDKGIFIFIDYGYDKDEWGLLYRKEGTLRGYFQHQLMTDVLKNVGETDITSDVYWDLIKQVASECGVHTALLKKQNEFLLQSGMLSYLEETTDVNPFSESVKKNRAIRSFLTSSMSESFDVCIQEKGCKHVTLWPCLQPILWE